MGKSYKVEMKKGIYYTGVVTEEDAVSIRLKTKRGEELVLNKGEILQALLDSIGRDEHENA